MFDFCKLLPKLRAMLYKNLLRQGIPLDYNQLCIYSSILQTCRFIYEEAKSFLYQNTLMVRVILEDSQYQCILATGTCLYHKRDGEVLGLIKDV